MSGIRPSPTFLECSFVDIYRCSAATDGRRRNPGAVTRGQRPIDRVTRFLGGSFLKWLFPQACDCNGMVHRSMIARPHAGITRARPSCSSLLGRMVDIRNDQNPVKRRQEAIRGQLSGDNATWTRILHVHQLIVMAFAKRTHIGRLEQ